MDTYLERNIVYKQSMHELMSLIEDMLVLLTSQTLNATKSDYEAAMLWCIKQDIEEHRLINVKDHYQRADMMHIYRGLTSFLSYNNLLPMCKYFEVPMVYGDSFIEVWIENGYDLVIRTHIDRFPIKLLYL